MEKMKIILNDDMIRLFQECIDTVDSYDSPDKPEALKQVCTGFLESLQQSISIETVMAIPSYLCLALLGAVRFKDEGKCIFTMNQGDIPSWDEIQIRKTCTDLVNNVRELDDDLAKQAVLVAFCLSHADQVDTDDANILRLGNIIQTQGGEDNDEWIE